MNTVSLPSPKPLMIAHRGLSGIEKENTCSAFVAAGNRSYFGIETDVHRTADGQFIVIHDDDTLRVSGDRMTVEETSMETLRSLRLTDTDGRRGRRDLMLPTLEEYIGICAKYGKTAVLELKNHMDGRDVEAVVRSIRELGWLERTVFISFDLPNLISLRELLPAQKAQYLIEEHVPADLMDTLARWRLDLDIHHPMLTAEMCRKIHAMGLEVNVWTVNTPEDARRVTEAGADYITTNILE